MHRTKIGARNNGIYSLVAGISGDTIVITDYQIWPLSIHWNLCNAYKHHSHIYIYRLNKKNFWPDAISELYFMIVWVATFFLFYPLVLIDRSDDVGQLLILSLGYFPGLCTLVSAACSQFFIFHISKCLFFSSHPFIWDQRKPSENMEDTFEEFS